MAYPKTQMEIDGNNKSACQIHVREWNTFWERLTDRSRIGWSQKLFAKLEGGKSLQSVKVNHNGLNYLLNSFRSGLKLFMSGKPSIMNSCTSVSTKSYF